MSGYVIEKSNLLANTFVALVAEKAKHNSDPVLESVADALKRKHKIAEAKVNPGLPKAGQEEESYHDIFENLAGTGKKHEGVFRYSQAQLLFLEYEAKINQLKVSGRTIATGHVIEARDGGQPKTADDWDYTFDKFDKADLSSETVEAILKKNGVARVSFTSHPTNPKSLNSTKALMKVDAALESPDTGALKAALELYRDTPINDLANKSPADELEEGLPVLDNSYYALPQLEEKRDDALRRHGYKGVGCALPALRALKAPGAAYADNADEIDSIIDAISNRANKTPITDENTLTAELKKAGIDPSVVYNHPKYRKEVNTDYTCLEDDLWRLSDGDGNKNMNAENLAAGVARLRSRIKELYGIDLQDIIDHHPAYADGARKLKEHLDEQPAGPEASSSLRAGLETLLSEAKKTADDSAGRQKLHYLLRRVKTFGAHFARFDLRHNANDVMDTVARLADKGELLRADGVDLGTSCQSIRDDAFSDPVAAKTALASLYPKGTKFADEADFRSNDLDKISKLIRTQYGDEAQGIFQTVDVINDKLNDCKYGSKQELTDDLSGLMKQLSSLPESEEITKALAHNELLLNIVEKQGLAFKDVSAELQSHMLSAWLADPELADKFQDFRRDAKSLSDDDPKDATGQNAARIFGRLAVIGENPDMCSKLIIAECKNDQHGLAALFALKMAGNQTGKEAEKPINICPLFESAEDLNNAPVVVEQMLQNPIFREHVAAAGELWIQQAKSDTARRGGQNKAKTAQENAAKGFYALAKPAVLGEDLAHITFHVFSGGGAALARGGGYIPEIPHINGKLAERTEINFKNAGISTTTIQGHQGPLLFSPISACLEFCEAFASQNALASAKLIEPKLRREEPDINLPEAVKIRDGAADLAQKTYLQVAYHPAMNHLFQNAPWRHVKQANNSSRAGSRSEDTAKDKPDAGAAVALDMNAASGLTANTIISNGKMDLLGQRSITVDGICRHTLTNALYFLGQREAMATVSNAEFHTKAGKKIEGSGLQSLYIADKGSRDLTRNNATALEMTDYDEAWRMMADERRPALAEIAKLAQEFQDRYLHFEKENPPQPDKQMDKTLLAWLEMNTWEVARYTHISITGNDPLERDSSTKLSYAELAEAINKTQFTLDTPLKTQWPSLARDVCDREEHASLTHELKGEQARILREKPEEHLTNADILAITLTFTACDVTNAPTGLSATRTTEPEALYTEKRLNECLIRDAKRFPALTELAKSMHILQTRTAGRGVPL